MKKKPDKNTEGSASFLQVLGMAVFCAWPILLFAQGPSWWTSRDVLVTSGTANDYGAVNQGQLKNIAVAAYQEMQANLVGGIGDTSSPYITGGQLSGLIMSWGTFVSGTFMPASGTNTNDYAPVNIGQLKTVAKPFYDRLIEIGYINHYPWDSSPILANDYAMANIGQVKNLFSFDVTYDSMGNGVPDWWERYYFGSGTENWLSGTAIAPAGNGLTVLQDYQQGNDPADYYNQSGTAISSTLTIISGTGQTSVSGTFLSSPFVVQVTGSLASPLANAPVNFTVDVGAGVMASDGSGTSATANSLVVRTGTDGLAQVYFRQPSDASFTSTVTAHSGTNKVTFNAITLSDTNAPAAPGDVSASVQGDGSVLVTWKDKSDNETGFIIQRSDDGGITWSTVGTVGPGITSFLVLQHDAGDARTSLINVAAAAPGGNIPSITPPPEISAIPVTQMTAIDISGSSITQDVTMIALSNTNSTAAFGYIDSGSSNFIVNTWVNETGVYNQAIPLSGTTDYGGNETYYPATLTPSGKLYGELEISYGFDIAAAFSSTGGAITLFIGDQMNVSMDFSSSIYTIQGINTDDTGHIGSGLTGAWWGDGVPRFGDENTGGTWYNHISLSGSSVIFSSFYPMAMNNNGWAVGSGSDGAYQLWNGTALLNISGYPVAINNQNTALSGLDGTGWILHSGSTTQATITSLLPVRFQNQISQISPLMISDENDSGQYSVVFNGMSLEGSGTGTLVQRTFLLKLTGTSSDLSILTPPAGTTLTQSAYISINKYGIISALFDPDGSTGPTAVRHAMILVPMSVHVDADNTSFSEYPSPENDDLGGAEMLAQNSTDEDKYPGVLLYINNTDTNGDGIPGYAQGINKFGNGNANACWGFEPLLINLPNLDLFPNAKFKFKYAASDPDKMVKHVDGLYANYILPENGTLRIWDSDGITVRGVKSADNDGDFVDSDKEYSVNDLGWTVTPLGDTRITLYIEAVDDKSADQ